MALDPTIGGVNSNTYVTIAEADAYWTSRAPFASAWAVSNEIKEALLITATRMFESMFSPSRILVRPKDCEPYYLIRRTWTGAPASTTQALLWPRTGMFTRTGVEILSTVLPVELKNAVSELAGYLSQSDRLVDNQIAALGLTDLTVGPISLSFKDDIEILRTLPTMVEYLLIPGWMTDETIEPLSSFVFEAM